VGPTDRAEGLRDAPACGELAGRADVGGQRGPRVGRCSTRRWVCVCVSLSISRCACVLSPRWDRLPGYEPWTAGETETEAEAKAKAEASAVHDRKRDGSGKGKRIRAGAGRRGTRFGCPGGYRGQITSHMYVQAWVDFVQMRQEAAHHASTSSRLRRRLQLQHHHGSASQPTTEAHPSSRPPLRVIHHGQRLHPDLRAFLWHGTSWPPSCIVDGPANFEQSGIAFAVSCSPKARLHA
jgi:hypothetical protein